MGLLSGTVAVTRFNVVVPPDGPDFERARFWEIEPGSEVRGAHGLRAFRDRRALRGGHWGRYVFRVRIDRIRPDATAVKERLRELIKTEMEATARPSSARRPARSCASWPKASSPPASGRAPRSSRR